MHAVADALLLPAPAAAAASAVPFLLELRALLDWTCSPTTLTWYNWLKLEDVRSSLYVQQCKLVAEVRGAC